MKADFAATVELKSEAMGTCEQSRHTNLFVCLVLHSPGPVSTVPGRCDSSSSTSSVHHPGS